MCFMAEIPCRHTKSVLEKPLKWLHLLWKVSALACALEELLVDQDRAYQMADANQEYVLGKLDNKVVHTQLANLYLRLLDDDAEQNT